MSEDKNLSHLLEDIEQQLKSSPNTFEISSKLLPEFERQELERILRAQFEEMGIELYLGEGGRHGYWDGQFAIQLKELLAMAVSAQLHPLLASMSPSICKFYRRLKESGEIDGKRLDLAIAVADGLIAARYQLPVPIAKISAYIVQEHLLESVCSSPAPKP